MVVDVGYNDTPQHYGRDLDAVMRALANEKSFTPGTNFRAWIFTIPASAFMAAIAWWIGTHIM